MTSRRVEATLWSAAVTLTVICALVSARLATAQHVSDAMASEAEAKEEALGDSRRQLLGGTWVPHPSCVATLPCYVNGSTAICVRNTTYNSTTGCGANLTEAVTVVPTSTCQNTTCSWGGCAADEIEVASKICRYFPPVYIETCCKKGVVATCRPIQNCTLRPWSPPPPPVPGVAVFAAKGSWDPFARGDKKVNAYIAAIYAVTVYEDELDSKGLVEFQEAFVRKVVRPMGGTRAWAYYQRQDTEWAFVETPTSFLIALRGTEGTTDILLSDLISAFTDPATEFGGTGVRIGQGFYAAFSKNRDFFLEEWKKFKSTSPSPNKPLWLTGHSLGGTLATLFGAYLQVQGHPVTGIYTFGSPIVGNDAWKAVYPLPNNTYRYEVPGDIVTQIPKGYENHVGIPAFVPPCAASVAAVQAILDARGDRRRALGVVASADPAGAASAAVGSKVRMCGVARVDQISAAGISQPVVEMSPCGDDDDEVPGAMTATRRLLAMPASLPPKAAVAAPPKAAASPPAKTAGSPPPAKAASSPPPVESPASEHSSSLSYLPNIFYCYLTAAEQATVPSYNTVIDM